MPINKVVFGDTTLIDLSGDTIYSTDEVASGITYHDRWGAVRTGTLAPPTTIRPSNASPPLMNDTSATYKVATSGYAIQSAPNLLLDTTGEGQALTVGRIYYDIDEDGGYFFHEKPSGGEVLVDTLLWTNPSPSSGSSGATITLSSSISDFDYIKLVYYYSKSDFRSYSVMVPVSEFKTQSGNNTTRSLYCGLQLSNGAFQRLFNYISDTSIEFTNAMRLNGNASNDSAAIPYKIYGVKAGSGERYVKIIEPTVVEGQNTIETGVTIKQLVIVWQNPNGSHPNYIYTGVWHYQRPDNAFRAFNTTSASAGDTSLPYTSSTAIRSVSGSSFILNVHQSDINNIGGNPRCYIYY